MSSRNKGRDRRTKPLEVVKYGHPALRSKGLRIEKIDDSIRTLAEEMIVTMYEEEAAALQHIRSADRSSLRSSMSSPPRMTAPAALG